MAHILRTKHESHCTVRTASTSTGARAARVKLEPRAYLHVATTNREGSLKMTTHTGWTYPSPYTKHNTAHASYLLQISRR